MLLEKYLELDLDFGISRDDLQLLFKECDMGLGEDMVESVFHAFPNSRQTKVLNALDFIEGFTLLTQGSPEEKLSLLYDTFDFQKRGEISFDEVTIMFMCSAQGLMHMSGLDFRKFGIPSDEQIANMFRQEFGFARGSEQEIPKSQFMAWAKRKSPQDIATLEEALNFLMANEKEKVQQKENKIEIEEKKMEKKEQGDIEKEKTTTAAIIQEDENDEQPKRIPEANFSPAAVIQEDKDEEKLKEIEKGKMAIVQQEEDSKEIDSKAKSKSDEATTTTEDEQEQAAQKSEPNEQEAKSEIEKDGEKEPLSATKEDGEATSSTKENDEETLA